ncbi:hypothetical protein RFI_28365, partial [Reticulomyxa filosa]
IDYLFLVCDMCCLKYFNRYSKVYQRSFGMRMDTFLLFILLLVLQRVLSDNGNYDSNIDGCIHESKRGNIMVELLLVEIQYLVESWKPHYNARIYHLFNKSICSSLNKYLLMMACIKYGSYYFVLNDVEFEKKTGGPYCVV